MAAPGPATVTPQQLAVDGRQRHALGGVGAPPGVIQDLLVGPPAGALHPGRQPIHAHRLADLGHLHQPFAQVIEAGDEGPVGLAQPQPGQVAQQQVQAVADLVLADPDHPGGASVGQSVQDHRTQGVQPDLQRQRRGAALARSAGWAQVREALGKPAQHLNGQGRTWAVRQRRLDLLEGVRTLQWSGLHPSHASGITDTLIESGLWWSLSRWCLRARPGATLVDTRSVST
jgi:hypothetical protein